MHETVLGREVENVELVDPGLNEDDRHCIRLFRYRCVLDDLHQAVAENDAPFGRRDVISGFEGAVIDDGKQAVAPKAIVDPVHEPLQDARSVAVDESLDGRGVRPEEVGRGDGVQVLAGPESGPSPLVFPESRDGVHEIPQPTAEHGIVAACQGRVIADMAHEMVFFIILIGLYGGG